MLKAKERLKNDLLTKPVTLMPPMKTVAQTVAKGSSRIAHLPTDTTKTDAVRMTSKVDIMITCVAFSRSHWFFHCFVRKLGLAERFEL